MGTSCSISIKLWPDSEGVQFWMYSIRLLHSHWFSHNNFGILWQSFDFCQFSRLRILKVSNKQTIILVSCSVAIFWLVSIFGSYKLPCISLWIQLDFTFILPLLGTMGQRINHVFGDFCWVMKCSSPIFCSCLRIFLIYTELLHAYLDTFVNMVDYWI